MVGVSFGASAQKKFEAKIKAVIAQTVEVVSEEKGYSEQQQQIISEALTLRANEGTKLHAKKLPTEEHKAAQKVIINNCRTKLNEEVEPGCATYILSTYNELRANSTK